MPRVPLRIRLDRLFRPAALGHRRPQTSELAPRQRYVDPSLPVGANGFGFIDKLSYASSVTDLEWAVAHNLTHEIMHTFGIGNHPDPTGDYLDAATATWSLLSSPSATLSPMAVQAIVAKNLGRNGDVSGEVWGELMVAR